MHAPHSRHPPWPYEITAPLGAGGMGEVSPDVTSGAILGDDRSALVSVASNRRPRDIRIILDWTALLGR